MNKNYAGANIYRAVALLWVMSYHCWVMLGYPAINNGIILLMIKLGGEIGVTLFFILSGFGIYFSIASNELRNGKFCWKQYISARVKRICPNYYFSLLLVIAFTGSAVYVSKSGIKDILAHVLFVHNLFVSTHGSINGVLWTMGVIAQFYLLAPILYRLVKKHPYFVLAISVILSISVKIFLFHFMLGSSEIQPVIRFIWSRQIFSSIDNFVIGMFVAWICSTTKELLKRKNILLEIVFMIALVCVCFWGDKMGIHTDTFSGYVYHSVLAVCLGGMLLCACSSRKYEGKFNNGISWIARNEYGIYLYHLCIVENMIHNSQFLQRCNERGLGIIAGVICIATAVIVGSILSQGMDSLVGKIFNKDTKVCC